MSDIASVSAGQQADDPPHRPVGGRRRRWQARWPMLLLAGTALILVAGSGFLAWAGAYQPLAEGGDWGSAGSGRWVNHFGPVAGDLYVPPGEGPFTIRESVENDGPAPVTIVDVAVDGLNGRHDGYPFAKAGPVTYQLPAGWTPRYRPLHGLVLAPGEAVAVNIPLRLANPCWQRNSGWLETGHFVVEERVYGLVTTWAAIPLRVPIINHPPGGPLGPSGVCGTNAAHPPA